MKISSSLKNKQLLKKLSIRTGSYFVPIPKKLVPTIITPDFNLTYDAKNSYWCLFHKNIEFNFEGSEVNLPTLNLLNEYLSWVESVQSHIDQNIKEMVNEMGVAGEFMDATKAYLALVTVESINKISILILGDESWGDMGYDIWIEGGVIMNEGFGD